MATAMKTPVMVNGLSDTPGHGKMARLAAEYISTLPDFELHNRALCGISSGGSTTVNGRSIELYNPAQRPRFAMENGFDGRRGIVIDFTRDSSVYANGVFYLQRGWNFVMAATGGQITDLQAAIRASAVSALIAPNLAKQVVGLETVIEKFNENLSGCSLRVKESHQEEKSDPSGTAIKFSKHYARLGVANCPFDGEDIKANPEKYKGIFDMIRDKEYQKNVLGVPEKYLGGHGWHTYLITEHQIGTGHNKLFHAIKDFLQLSPIFESYSVVAHESAKDGQSITRTSPDGNARFSVELKLVQDGERVASQIVKKHNINGRDIYAQGVPGALRFLRGRPEGEHGKVFSMVDTL